MKEKEGVEEGRTQKKKYSSNYSERLPSGMAEARIKIPIAVLTPGSA